MKIDFISYQGLQEIERDKLSIKAAADLILDVCMRLYPNPKEAQVNAHNICKTIEKGQTVEIKHPTNGSRMVFQIPSLRKEKETRNG